MKRLIVISLLLVAIGIGGFSALTHSGSDQESIDLGISFPNIAGGNQNVAFELVASRLPTQHDLMVYRVKNREVTPAAVQEIGKILGIDGEALPVEDGKKISMMGYSRGQSLQLLVWVDSGAIELRCGDTGAQLYPSLKPDLPSNEQAKQIALDFLEDIALLPSNEEIKACEIVNGGSYSQVYLEMVEETGKVIEKTVEEYPTHLLVRFPRMIDGHLVVGPGAKFGVRITDGGEVASIVRAWRNIEPYKDFEVKSPEEAYKQLEGGLGSHSLPPGCAHVSIQEIELGYWMDSMDEQQDYVAPVYVFKGKCFDEDGNYTEEYTGYCEAVKKS